MPNELFKFKNLFWNRKICINCFPLSYVMEKSKHGILYSVTLSHISINEIEAKSLQSFVKIMADMNKAQRQAMA